MKGKTEKKIRSPLRITNQVETMSGSERPWTASG